MKHKLALSLALATFVGSARADVFIVDQEGLGDATTIRNGTLLAQDGDVVIVRPGNYVGDVAVSGRGIWLVAQQPGTVTLSGTLTVVNLPLNSQFVAMDLNIVQAVGGPATGLSLFDCDGGVTIERCSFRQGTSAALTRSARVSLVDTQFTGFEADGLSFNPIDGGLGLRLVDSRVAMWGCEVTGGSGQGVDSQSSVNPGAAGGSGLSLLRSRIFASGCTIAGGRGGSHLQFFGTGGVGGHAVVAGGASDLFVVGSNLVSGPGGTGGGANGPSGQTLFGSGRVRMSGSTPEIHRTETFARGQSVLDLELTGEPGETMNLFLYQQPSLFLFDYFAPQGRRIVPPLGTSAASIGGGGILGPTGMLSASIPIPLIPTNPPVITATFAAVARRASGGTSAARLLFGAPMPVVGINCDALLPDCDGSGRSDLCEILEGTLADLNVNGRPDVCDPDCNGNGVPDDLDILTGTSADTNNNGIPDECENQAATWYVSADPGPPGNGSFAAPLRSLSAALNVAISGHEIILFDGVYSGPENAELLFGDRAIELVSMNGPAQCIIDLQDQARAFRCSGASSGAGVIVRGIEFRNGAGTFSSPGGLSAQGGFINARESKITIEDCVFDSGRGSGGGAMFFFRCDVEMRDCTFTDNEEFTLGNFGGGGAIFVQEVVGTFLVDRCTFIGNSTVTGGGVIDVAVAPSGSVHFSRSSFLENTSLRTAGVFAVRSSSFLGEQPRGPITIDQCLFAGNTAADNAGVGRYVGTADDVISNCTFAGNQSGGSGASLELLSGTTLAIYNSIMRGGMAGVGAEIHLSDALGSGLYPGPELALQRTNLEGGLAQITQVGAVMLSGLNVIDVDPLFALPAGPDGDPLTFEDNEYRLLSGSPSVDAGDNALISPDLSDANGNGNTAEPMPFDLDGNPRRRDDPATPDTGAGSPPLVDHGCYERQ